jgi:hypothetical protein
MGLQAVPFRLLESVPSSFHHSKELPTAGPRGYYEEHATRVRKIQKWRKETYGMACGPASVLTAWPPTIVTSDLSPSMLGKRLKKRLLK